VSAPARHNIDDTYRVGPIVRLSFQILRDGLAQGLRCIAFTVPSVGAPIAQRQLGTIWAPFMAFPSAAFEPLTAHLQAMAGISAADAPVGGTILVRVNGQDASVAVMARRDERGNMELELLFPPAAVAAAT
jgi:hypothetical protein